MNNSSSKHLKLSIVFMLTIIGIFTYGCAKDESQTTSTQEKEEKITEKEYYEKNIAPTLNGIVDEYMNMGISKDINGYGDITNNPFNNVEDVHKTMQILHDKIEGWIQQIDEMEDYNGKFSEENQKLIDTYKSNLWLSLNSRLAASEKFLKLLENEEFNEKELEHFQFLVTSSEVEYSTAIQARLDLEEKFEKEE